MPSSTSIGKGFDRLASIYDLVVWLVFGNKISNLKKSFLEPLVKADSALIIGGGSSKILTYALESDIATNFVYAELSERMIEKTKSRISANDIPRIEFCHDFEPKLQDKKFDYIVLPFILDCYRNRDVKGMLSKFSDALTENGSIVFFDFNLSAEDGFEPRKWKIAFIKLLYIFFRLTTSIPAKKLPSFGRHFNEAGFYKERTELISKGWIQAIEWKRENKMKANA
jgi:ubiquinone/menaquinone biosynthesis C-methylase UbiE